jgi:hypothetical protein
MPPKTSLIPSPQQLAAYQQIDPKLPVEIVQVADRSDRRNFIYAMTALVSGWTAFIFAVLTFAYLIMHDHAGAAASVLGTGVLGIVYAMIRARLQGKKPG